MKKILFYLLLSVLVSGVAGAEEECAPEAPAVKEEGGPGGGRRDNGSGKKEDWRKKAQEHYEKVNCLAKAAREETDPVKKEQLVDELRALLTKGAEGWLAHFRRRIEEAEENVEQMKVRLEDGEANMEARVEEHLQRLLTCEPPPWANGDGKDEDRTPPPGEGPPPGERPQKESPPGE